MRTRGDSGWKDKKHAGRTRWASEAHAVACFGNHGRPTGETECLCLVPRSLAPPLLHFHRKYCVRNAFAAFISVNAVGSFVFLGLLQPRGEPAGSYLHSQSDTQVEGLQEKLVETERTARIEKLAAQRTPSPASDDTAMGHEKGTSAGKSSTAVSSDRIPLWGELSSSRTNSFDGPGQLLDSEKANELQKLENLFAAKYLNNVERDALRRRVLRGERLGIVDVSQPRRALNRSNNETMNRDRIGSRKRGDVAATPRQMATYLADPSPAPAVMIAVGPSSICGNSQKEPPEECDDGNLEPFDGCSASCTIEAGWSCSQLGCSLMLHVVDFSSYESLSGGLLSYDVKFCLRDCTGGSTGQNIIPANVQNAGNLNHAADGRVFSCGQRVPRLLLRGHAEYPQ
jgi:cysteine-rich repeat protein